jgi:hypothetical protein
MSEEVALLEEATSDVAYHLRILKRRDKEESRRRNL